MALEQTLLTPPLQPIVPGQHLVLMLARVLLMVPTGAQGLSHGIPKAASRRLILWMT